HQWSKNLFIFLPAFFGLKLMEIVVIQNLLITFFAFSFLASAVYVFNDMLDIDSDRVHPNKRKRPLASGAISIGEASILIIFLLCLSSALFVILNNTIVIAIAIIYLIQNILYT